MASPFGGPQIDFSALQGIGESLGRGYKERKLNSILSSIPKGPNGEIDFNAASQALMQGGFADEGLKVAQFATKQKQGMTPYQAEMLRLKELEISGRQPKAPSVHTFTGENGQPVDRQWNGSEWVDVGPGKGSTPNLASNIKGGLQNLLTFADTYDDASFESALGPFQGSTPDSLIGAGAVNVARGAGELSNWWGGGKTVPSEVRSNIQGATEALAAAVKPLIRKPGEGVWTDADQARLVSVVGDLSQSRNKAEFKRRLQAVAKRIESNFGLPIEFDPNQTPGGAAADVPKGTQIPLSATPQQANTGGFPTEPTMMPGASPNPQSQGPMALPPKEQLEVGQVYNLPSGQQGLWTGEGFELLN